MTDFQIDIINPHWIDGDPENDTDECSHGQFILTIAGKEILTKDDDIRDWTTNTSALLLLRTLESDFSGEGGYGILLHCGMLQMISCPISVDWIWTHEAGKVIITKISKRLSARHEGPVEFQGLTGIVHIDHYKNEILKVARQVKDFYARSRPRKLSGPYLKINEEFWQQFDSLLLKHSG